MIHLHLNGKQMDIPSEPDRLLSTVLEPYGFPMPCAGNHTCGKCKVTAYGALSPLCAQEKALLTVEEQLSNCRLACCTTAKGDCTVYANLPETMAVAATPSPCSGIHSPFGKTGWALAADIGTTTIAVYLLPLRRPDPSYSIGLPNQQAAYGADVISRIARCGESGVTLLQTVILHQLDQMFAQLLKEHTIPATSIRGVVLTGNTTMLHLLAGLDPAGIAVAPYTPQSLFGVMYTARGQFPSLPPAAPVYLAPCISAFIGADTVCALLAVSPKQNELLLDIGTNGELALVTDAGIFCCSTAAGPAFEGTGLACGMPAVTGAIDRVVIQNGRIILHTIGDAPARGICGTGAVSALAALLTEGILEETGRLNEPYSTTYPLTPDVFLTQADIRNLQLAKAALAAGIDSLLESAGLLVEQIKTLYIAGGFGGAIDAEAAARIGLIPAELSGRAVPVGNAAGLGACKIATSQAALDQAESLAKTAKPIDLTESAFFNDRFIEQLLFPPKKSPPLFS